jgi:peptidoglycan-associated lipoprotein
MKLLEGKTMARIALTAVAALFLMTGCAQKRVMTLVLPPSKQMKPELTVAQKEELEALLRGAIIHFEFDEAMLTPISRGRLEFLAEALLERPWAAIRIAGHCDERGTVEYNLALGMKRAQTARDYLVRMGVSEEAVEVVSYGAELPAIQGDDEKAFAANRRDEMVPAHVDLLGMINKN